MKSRYDLKRTFSMALVMNRLTTGWRRSMMKMMTLFQRMKIIARLLKVSFFDIKMKFAIIFYKNLSLMIRFKWKY